MPPAGRVWSRRCLRWSGRLSSRYPALLYHWDLVCKQGVRVPFPLVLLNMQRRHYTGPQHLSPPHAVRVLTLTPCYTWVATAPDERGICSAQHEKERPHEPP